MALKNLRKPTLTLFFLAFFVLLFSSAESQASKKYGLGVIAGQPSGLSGRYVLNNSNSIDAALSWRLGDAGYFGAFADYLFDNAHTLKLDNLSFPVHYGAGVGLGVGDSFTAVGVRVPAGLSYYFQEQPIQAFFELAASLLLVPETNFDVEAFIGARYYF